MCVKLEPPRKAVTVDEDWKQTAKYAGWGGLALGVLLYCLAVLIYWGTGNKDGAVRDVALIGFTFMFAGAALAHPAYRQRRKTNPSNTPPAFAGTAPLTTSRPGCPTGYYWDAHSAQCLPCDHSFAPGALSCPCGLLRARSGG